MGFNGPSSATATAAPVADQPTNLSSLLVLPSLAASRTISVVAYFRYHQHQPSLTSVWLTFVPSGKITSAMVRPYLSLPNGLEHDFFPKDQAWRSLLRSVAVGLAFLWTVDATEADTFRMGVVQDFDGVAVEEGDDLGSKVQREYGGEGGNEEA